MRTCAQAGSIRAMPETEIPRATRVDIYLFKRAEPVCRFPLRLSVFNPSIGFQSVYRFPIRPSAPYSSIGFQSVYRLPIRPSAPCSSIGFSPFRGLFFKHGENPRHRFLKFLVRRIVKDQQIVLFLGRVKLGGHLELQPAIYSSQLASFQVSRSELRAIILWRQTSLEVFTQIITSFAPFAFSVLFKLSMYVLSRISRVNGALISTLSS